MLNSKEGAFSRVATRLAVICIAAAVLVLIMAFAVLGGFRKVITEKVYHFDAHLTAEKIDHFKFSNPLQSTDSIITEITSLPYVSQVNSYATLLGIIQYEDELEGVVVYGVDTNFLVHKFQSNIIDGRFPDLKNKKEIIVSSYLSNRLNINTGDTVLFNVLEDDRVRHRWLIVTGIYETNLEEIDKKKVIGSIDLVRKFYRWKNNEIEGIAIDLHDTDSLQYALNQIDQIVDIDTRVDNIEDRYFMLFDWLEIISSNVVFLIVIVSVIVFINVTSISLVLVMEKTSTIGLLKALGASEPLLGSVFLKLLMNIGIRGVLLGNALALIISALQFYFKILPLDPENYYMEYVPINWSFLHYILINLGMFTLLTIVVLVPLIVINQISPAKAVKFE